MCQDINCALCIPCECGHRADEHMAGIGQCFLCNCPGHSVSWDTCDICNNKLESKACVNKNCVRFGEVYY